MKQVEAAPTMFSLLQTAHALEARLEDALGSVELSGPKFAALTKLIEAGEALPLSTLAEKLTCVRSNITQLVDRLEAEGLVRRVDDPADRRSKRAEVTSLGRKRQAAGAKKVEALEGELARSLAGLDLTAIRDVLAVGH